MKTILTVIGVLTIAQWIFVGMLHGFLAIQEKRTPETLSKLHDVPVLGGYFPAVKVKSDEIKQREKDQDYADRAEIKLIQARKYYDLPKAFDDEKLESLVDELKKRKDQLGTEREQLKIRWSQLEEMTAEVEKRETAVIENQKKLDELARRLKKDRDEMDVVREGLGAQQSAIEAVNLKKMAKWANSMKADAVAEVLLTPAPDETSASREKRLEDAARLLSLMDVEQVGKVIEAMDPVDRVRVLEKKKLLPVSAKGK